MQVRCRIESEADNPTPLRDGTAKFSRVPAKGEKVCLFSDADVLAVYMVTEVIHFAHGVQLHDEYVDAALTLTAAPT
ncbi:hypothetical protein WME89_48865 [Sorangium sp. So ce321]|uniref:hypothetical protein n=1 Tax=Sorangium sp. So ce321 TaxID=3133300 RepID=UPI003F5EFF44